MTFNEAKRIIRTELTLASDEKLAEVIDAARAGEMPYHDADPERCCSVCLAGRIHDDGADLPLKHPWWILSNAFGRMGVSPGATWSACPFEDDDEASRRRVVLAMALAEVRARMRASGMAAAVEVELIGEVRRCTS